MIFRRKVSQEFDYPEHLQRIFGCILYQKKMLRCGRSYTKVEEMASFPWQTQKLKSSVLDTHGVFCIMNAFRCLSPGEKHTLILAFCPSAEKKVGFILGSVLLSEMRHWAEAMTLDDPLSMFRSTVRPWSCAARRWTWRWPCVGKGCTKPSPVLTRGASWTLATYCPKTGRHRSFRSVKLLH